MRIKIFCGTLLLLMLNVVALFAQTDAGTPCGGTDPDAVCPLDSWVVVLAAVATAAAAIHLYRRQQSIGANVLVNNSKK